MKKLCKSLIVLCICLALTIVGSYAPNHAVAAGKKPPYTIAFANGWIGNFWRTQLILELEKAAEYYKGKGLLKELLIANSPADVTLQLNQLNSFINKGVDAIMPNPVSAPALNPIIARAKAKGILTVVANDPAAHPDAVTVVGDNYTWQKIQVEWLVRKMNGKGEIIMITGVPGNPADILRVQACRDVLKNYPDIKVLASAPGWWDEAKAQQAMATFLATYPKLDGLLIQDAMGGGVLRAWEAAGRKPPVMTGDFSAGFLRQWAEWELDSIGVPYAPSHAATTLGFTIKLLQGRKIDPEKFSPNPMDPNLQNAIFVPIPYVITNDGEDMSDRYGKITRYIRLEEALGLVEAMVDTVYLDRRMSDEEIDTYFLD